MASTSDHPAPPAFARGWHTFVPDDHPAAYLLTAAAVRERCGRVMDAAEQNLTTHFAFDAQRVGAAAEFVVGVTRERYPDLRVPYHSRWRHFEAGGFDRWRALASRAGLARAEAARTAIDLVIPSVLLDAGAGAAWRYRDGTSGLLFSRSEGLAVASLSLFASGALSSYRERPLRSDGSALANLAPATVAQAFQVDPDNPLLGLDGRTELLRRLGRVATATPAVFGSPARLGGLYDYLAAHAPQGRISAGFVFQTLVRALLPVWPERQRLAGISLGDCWRHDAARRDPSDPTDGFVPFHKLTQWLAYSLVEPLAEGGLEVAELDTLSALPEYRNGGLLLDLGVLVPKHGRLEDLARATLAVDASATVEWRALTVIALDRVADAVRARLGLGAAAFPLARVLEGGTWAAGRKLAGLLRPGGGPPLDVASDGTVF